MQFLSVLITCFILNIYSPVACLCMNTKSFVLNKVKVREEMKKMWS